MFWLILWSASVSALLVYGLKDGIWDDNFGGQINEIMLRSGLAFVGASVVALIFSYLLVHAWLNRPRTTRGRFWLVAASVILGLLTVILNAGQELGSSRNELIFNVVFWFAIYLTSFGFILTFICSLWDFIIWLHSPKTFVIRTVRPSPRWRVRMWNCLLIWSMLVGAVAIACQDDEVVNDWHCRYDRTFLVELEIVFAAIAIIAFVASYQAVRIWQNRATNRKVLVWLPILSVISSGLLVSFMLWNVVAHGFMPPLRNILLVFACNSLILLTLWLWLYSLRKFIRWLFSWRILKRCLLALAVLVGLALVFRTEEDWRGKYVWKKYRPELAARGEKIDIRDFAPPPVPDDQNFAMAPVVATSYEWLLDKSGRRLDPPRTNVVARLMINRERPDNWIPDGLWSGNWRQARMTDLKAWQDYYRATTFTRVYGYSNDKEILETNALAASPFPTSPQPQTPAADVLLALSRYDGVLAELQQACDRPFSRFPLNYDAAPFYTLMLPHLASLQSSAQVLQLRAIARLQAGKTDDALRDVKMMLRLAQSVRMEPELLSHLVQIHLIEFALQPIWEGLAARRWSDAQLQVLQQELQKVDLVADLQLSLRGERAELVEALGYMDKNRNLFPKEQAAASIRMLLALWPGLYNGLYGYNGLFSQMPNPARGLPDVLGFCFANKYSAPILCWLPPGGWYEQNKLTAARIFQEKFLPAVVPEKYLISQQASANAAGYLNEQLSERNINFKNVFVREYIPGMGGSMQKFAAAQSAVDMAALACALERYWLANGNYPENLSALAPEFVEKVPPDVVNGQPLHYRRTGAGRFQLYSEGWNGKDDGGMVGTNQTGSYNPYQGDWVWKYPAK